MHSAPSRPLGNCTRFGYLPTLQKPEPTGPCFRAVSSPVAGPCLTGQGRRGVSFALCLNRTVRKNRKQSDRFGVFGKGVRAGRRLSPCLRAHWYWRVSFSDASSPSSPGKWTWGRCTGSCRKPRPAASCVSARRAASSAVTANAPTVPRAPFRARLVRLQCAASARTWWCEAASTRWSCALPATRKTAMWGNVACLVRWCELGEGRPRADSRPSLMRWTCLIENDEKSARFFVKLCWSGACLH